MTSSTMILGHRGASHDAPENTLAAFALALEMGADGVELDVHRTADGHLVVHHDAELPAVGLVADRTFAELRATCPEVPTLAEVFDVCRDARLINVEIKCCSWDADPDPDRVVARGVAALVAERDCYEQVAVSSFDLTIIDDLRGIDNRITTGWLVQGVDPSKPMEIAQERGHSWLHPDWGNLHVHLASTMESSRRLGVAINTWTVDDPAVIRAFADAGVQGVITNRPDVGLAALRD